MKSIDGELDSLLRAEIAEQGPISFKRFMEQALYHPGLGYYRRDRDPFGVGGDFYTSSQLQPVFGRLIARWIGGVREAMGSPEDFRVVELGAGRGETARIVAAALPGVEVSAIDLGSPWPEKEIRGVVFSNELFDALPVHAVERRDGAILERLVGVERDRFVWAGTGSCSAELSGYVERYAPALAEGGSIEVNLAALEKLEMISAALVEGCVLTIDYGYTAREIEAGRFGDGSLMSYRRHQANPDVLAEPGGRDITAHVNFTALIERGRELGLEANGLESQAMFLSGIGDADEFASALASEGESEAFKLRMQLKTLLFGMGETFRVLVQRH